jgi:putative ATP-dependent endonuclease of OLD family
MLFAQGVILVEGAAEMFLVPAIAALMGVDLEARGITVCAVHGTDFAPYFRVLGPSAFGIPQAVVTDGDPTENGRAGIERGRILATSVMDMEVPGDPEAIEGWLAEAGIFVGARTLELDLLPFHADAFAQAMDDLLIGANARRNARAELDGALDGRPDQEQRLLARIDRIGKGRFAQRVAPLMTGVDSPEYLTAAIRYIAGQIGP